MSKRTVLAIGIPCSLMSELEKMLLLGYNDENKY